MYAMYHKHFVITYKQSSNTHARGHNGITLLYNTMLRINHQTHTFIATIVTDSLGERSPLNMAPFLWLK